MRSPGCTCVRMTPMRQNAQTATEDQRIIDIAWMIKYGPVDSGNAHLIAIVAHTVDDATGNAARRKHTCGQALRRVSNGPKQRISVQAIGCAETPNTSRITPPTPVFAPPNGSMAEGWLCVSTLKAISCVSVKRIMPALSLKAETSHGWLDLLVARIIYCLSRP